jgi:hypothetical protein
MREKVKEKKVSNPSNTDAICVRRNALILNHLDILLLSLSFYISDVDNFGCRI